VLAELQSPAPTANNTPPLTRELLDRILSM
jgi:hypothetical protein